MKPLTAPTDLELMLYLDGELEEPRLSEVARFLGDIPEKSGEPGNQQSLASARAKLVGLEAVGEAVRRRAEEVGEGFSVADAVMARIAEAEPPKPLPIRPVQKAAANDNAVSRRIFALAAVAVAAAAAMMVWSRAEAPGPVAERPMAPLEAPPAPAPSPAASAEASAEASEPAAEEDMGVVVAAVDFGAHSGSIFYVPGGPSLPGETTTVVWVADEVPGGE